MSLHSFPSIVQMAIAKSMHVIVCPRLWLETGPASK